jgi:hypothetical protein
VGVLGASSASPLPLSQREREKNPHLEKRRGLLAADLQGFNHIYWKNQHEDFQGQAVSDPDD